MLPYERLLSTLQHREPDRVPFDLGSTRVTGITKGAYQRLADALDITVPEVRLFDVIQQLAQVDEEICYRLKIDTRGLMPNCYRKFPPKIERTDKGRLLKDEWGVTWRMPTKGLYFDPVIYPLAGSIEETDVEKHRWPNPQDPRLLTGLKKTAKEFYEQGYPGILEGFGAGIFEEGLRVRGYTQFYMDLVANSSLAARILDKILEIKIAYWDNALSELGNYVQIIREGDDLGGQDALLISPQTYRQVIKPKHKELFSFIKKKFPHIHIMYHSDGAIQDVIPDLIDLGIDIINPVQFTAKGMDVQKLKKTFGKDLVFWGGGVDTQRTLPAGHPEEVRAEVRRQIEALAPGGGFVFSTVHNIQDDVPVENIMAMWETLQKYGKY